MIQDLESKNIDLLKWKTIADGVDYAFQPIVDVHSGVCLGYEALIREYEKFGFANIYEIFDKAYEEGCLFKLEMWLREKAIEKFIQIKDYYKFKLFYNLDNRIIFSDDYQHGLTLEFLQKLNLTRDFLCFEISERHEIVNSCKPDELLVINNYKRQSYRIAIDDFGSGYSGLQLLYYAEPDYIKIDRFFIKGIESDSKKKLFVSKVVNLAHILGIGVIAEGVETQDEFYQCREINCDYVQGYLIQKPTLYTDKLHDVYHAIKMFHSMDKRNISFDKQLILEQMEHIKPICLYNLENNIFVDLNNIFERFRENKNNSFFPLVNSQNEPLGIIREKELKEYVYSKYGKDLLMNKSIGKTVMDFVVKCQTVDINTKIEEVLEYFVVENTFEGVIITENGRYTGFLSSWSLLKILNEKNVAIARDQNPLTKLQGNELIHEFTEKALLDTNFEYNIVHFDFDNFKPFNDKYGFRRGDRAIILFSEILKKYNNTKKFFIGHIGGDDFFLGYKNNDNCSIYNFIEAIKEIINKFRDDVKGLYDDDDKKNGYIISIDREGNEKRFPLMTVSAAAIHLPINRPKITFDELSILIAKAKKEAKKSSNRLVSIIVDSNIVSL